MSVRVLIAEPDESLLRSYTRYLLSEGVQVATATNAVDCVSRLREWEPNVLVLDPDLPWGWGDGVLAMMWEEPNVPDVPVLLLSDEHSEHSANCLEALSVQEHHRKPLPPDTLLASIQRLSAHAV